MEISEVKDIEKMLKEEIDKMGKSENRDALAKERFIPILKQEFDLIFLKTTQNLYYIIQDHPLTHAYCMVKGDLIDPSNLRDYQSNLKRMLSVSEKIATTIKFFKKSGVTGSFDFEDYADVRRQYTAFLKLINSYISSAIYLTECAKTKSASAYLKQLNKTLPTMKNFLVESSKYIDSWKRYGADYSQVFNGTLEFFAETVSESLKAIEFVQAEEKRAMEEKRESQQKLELKPGKKIEFVPNPAEQERIKMINEANMMYDELCENTMRDLEKQVPYSVREMYDYFVNVKFAKFVKSFQMPLSDSASLKMAKEVCHQLVELNNYISRISENAQTTNIYMMKD